MRLDISGSSLFDHLLDQFCNGFWPFLTNRVHERARIAANAVQKHDQTAAVELALAMAGGAVDVSPITHLKDHHQ